MSPPPERFPRMCLVVALPREPGRMAATARTFLATTARPQEAVIGPAAIRRRLKQPGPQLLPSTNL